MIRKMGMLAMAAAALVALVVPATASAQWTKHHQTLGQNDQIQFTFQFKFQGEIGSVECQIDSKAQLLAGQTTANVTSFEVDLTNGGTVTDKCSVGGGLASLGCTDVATVTSEGFPWVAHLAGTQSIDITTGTIQNHLHGGIFCPKTQQLTPGTMTIQTTEPDTWTQAHLSGQLQAHSSGTTQKVTISGSGTITPGCTYGGHGLA